MAGMNRQSGAEPDELEHIIQSVRDILSTRRGDRVGRRDYGSLVPALIDQPMTGPNILRIFAATALALTRWEDRIRVRRIGLAAGDRAGAATLSIEAERVGARQAGDITRILLPLIR
ncbi:GPW/gp25 family protein [Sphingobium yanoikuyae]|uniref:GPW/gp25 family protein n=1 Tax=Sphingobium yanoikuyae TaxID=13690 RepID=UPI002FDA4F9E